MIEKLQEKVSISMYYNRTNGAVMPHIMRWQGRLIQLTKLGYHHQTYEGRTLIHYFHVTDGHLAFKLKLNTTSLHWTLVEVSDGSPD